MNVKLSDGFNYTEDLDRFTIPTPIPTAKHWHVNNNSDLFTKRNKTGTRNFSISNAQKKSDLFENESIPI